MQVYWSSENDGWRGHVPCWNGSVFIASVPGHQKQTVQKHLANIADALSGRPSVADVTEGLERRFYRETQPNARTIEYRVPDFSRWTARQLEAALARLGHRAVPSSAKVSELRRRLTDAIDECK